MMETYETSAQVVSMCDDCGEDNDVNRYCLDCHGKLCKNCTEKHLKKKLTCHHRVLSLTDPQSVRDRQSASVPCADHPGKVYSTWCKKCQIACCSDCMVLSHSKHEFLSLEEAAENAREKTTKYKEILINYCDKDVPSGIDKIEERISDVAARRKQYKGQIKEKVDSLRKTLEEFECKLNDEVDQMLDSEEDASKKTLAKIMDNKETISSVVNTCEQRLNHVGYLQMLTLSSEVPDISTLLLPATTLEPEVTLGISKFEPSSAHDIIGKLSKATKQDKILDEVTSRPDPTVGAMRQVHSLTTEGDPDRILDASKDEIWIRTGKVMRKYNIYKPGMFRYFLGGGTEGSRSEINLAVDLYDICMGKENMLLGTDQLGKRVVTISNKGDITTLHDVSPLIPSGIFMNDEKELFVGLCSESLSGSTIEKQIVVLSSDGKSAEVRYETNAIRQPLFHNHIHRITQGSKGDCIVVDGHKRVVCIGNNKYVKWTFHGNHISDVEYDTSYNRTFICDVGKHEIMALCMKGCRLNIPLSNGIKTPISLGKCKSGIVVGEEDNKISVWQ